MKNKICSAYRCLLVGVSVCLLATLLSGCCLMCLGLVGDDGYSLHNPKSTKVYPCYAEEDPQPESVFYGLLEAQQFYNTQEYDRALSVLDPIIDNYSEQAREMQLSLTERPWISKEEIFKYDYLNAVGTALVIKGLIYMRQNRLEMAEELFNEQSTDYAYALCYNPKGWFIDLDRESRDLLEELHHKQKKDK